MRYVPLSATLVAAFVAVQTAAAESTYLELLPVPETFLEPVEGAEILRPGDGEVLVVGWIEHPDFAVSDVNNIAVRSPDGRALPLWVEEDLLYEFDRIVRARIAFPVPEELLRSPDALTLEWGAETVSENRKVAGIALDPSMRDRYRTFRIVRSETASEATADMSSTIEVIADSQADYYFLWYLLPMAVIFVILSIRRIHARHSDR